MRVSATVTKGDAVFVVEMDNLSYRMVPQAVSVVCDAARQAEVALYELPKPAILREEAPT